MEWLNQMVGEPYYLFHFLAFFSYFIAWSSASNVLFPQIAQLLFHRMVREEVFTLIMDYRLTLWYVVVFSGSSSKLTPLQLEVLLTEGNTSRFWLIHKNLSFRIVDHGLFPNAAEKFGISPGGSTGLLPTYILFENATEVSRFPKFNFEATPTPSITKRLLAHLDRHLLEYVNGK